MLILRILGVLLLVLAGLALLAFALTLPRTGVYAHGKDGAIQIFLRYGRLRLRVYPLPCAFRKKTQKPAPPKEPAAPKAFDVSALDLGDAVCFLLDFLDDMRDAVRIDTLRADVVLATGDAARTGILLGACAALLGMITPVLENTFTIRDYHIAVDGDFQSAKPRWEGTLAFSARPIRLLYALWKRRRTLLQFYDALTAKSPQETSGSFTQKDGGETQ